MLVLLVNSWLGIENLCAHASQDKRVVSQFTKIPVSVINEFIQENYTFYGLASYYNNVNYYLVENDDLRRINEGEVIELNQVQWLAVVGHLNVLLIQAMGLSVHLDESKLVIDNPEILSQSDAVVKIVSQPALPPIALVLDQIRYAHLWRPLAWLAKLVESSLVAIQANIVSNWGLAIVVFSVLLKLLLLPIGVMTVRFQRKVSQHQAVLAPQLTEIKAKFDGEQAHERIMVAHKALGITPFYTLRPMVGLLIQIPILVAVFNALGEMPQLAGASFLWIENLAHPDSIGTLPFVIPLFGDKVSLLPMIMTVATVFSTFIFQNRHAPSQEVNRQKRNLYLMAGGFFVLFYPFPAAMVLYWTLANILQAVQQELVKI